MHGIYKFTDVLERAVITSITVTGSTPPCKHETGTYRTIPARWFGRRQVFVCRDCENVLDPNTKQKI